MKRVKTSLYPDQELRRRTMAWAVKLKVSPRVVRVQAMRRKWGSCSSAGTVTLARDLVTERPRFQDFVIVHELLHLRFPSHQHGRLFKALMSAYVPGWKDTGARRRRPEAAPGAGLKQQPRPTKAAYKRASRFVGGFRDAEGVTDVAENHDHYLVEAILERKGRRGGGRK